VYKKAVITDEVSQELEVALKLAQEFKLDGVEIRSVWEKGPHELDDEEVRKVQALVRDYGLEVCCIASPFFKCDIDSEEEYSRHIGILRKAIQLAHSLDARVVRGFVFWRKGRLEDQWSRILRKLDEAAKMAEANRVILGIENEASTMIGTGRDLAPFLREVDSPWVKAVWDPCNSYWDLTSGEKPYPDGYRSVKDLTAHIHIKDAKRVDGKLEAAPLGEGEVGIPEQVKGLIADGYAGYVSLETHYRVTQVLEEEVVNLPKGSRFSAGGYQGTKTCLINWKRIEGEALSPL